MSEPFIGEIRMFAGNFAPRDWSFCDGQLLAVSQNDALFSLLGTIYGGDGITTFGLPDLRGRISLHAGTGPGLSSRNPGSKSGDEIVTLTTDQLASHTHDYNANTQDSTGSAPQGKVVAKTKNPDTLKYLNTIDPKTAFHSNAIQSSGGSQPHSNLQPSLCINYIIALLGIYPSKKSTN